MARAAIATARSAPPTTTPTATPSGAAGSSAPALPTFDETADIARINQAKALVVQLVAIIQSMLLGKLSAKQSRALLKARLAGLQVVPTLVNLVAVRPTLAPTGISPSAVKAQYAVMQAFVTFAATLSSIATQVQDTSRQLQTQMYKLALDIYAIAERSASTDGEVQGAVTQMKAAMKTGPRVPRKTVTTLPKPVTAKFNSAGAAAAAQAAAAAYESGAGASSAGSAPVAPPASPAAPATPASGGGSGSGSAGTGNSSPTVAGTPTATVTVYGPSGVIGQVPPTNGGTGSSSK